jgi:hypothetical protein
MPYEAKATKTYDQPIDDMIKSISEVFGRLGGKASKKNNPAQGYFETNFNKKIKGEYMVNRVQLEVKIDSQSADQCAVTAEAYPVDPVGQKLMFGVRGKPAGFVLDTFFTELEAQLEA